MRKIVFLFSIILTVTLLMTSAIGCQSRTSSTPRVSTFSSPLELYAQTTSMEEAAKVIGISIPVPDYLPAGFEIQELYVQSGSVRLLISDGPIEKRLVTHTDAAGTRQRYEVQSKMEMSVSWSSESKIPVRLPVEKVDINGRTGYLLNTSNPMTLIWNWFPEPDEQGMFELGLEVGRGITKEELVKIAESVEFDGAPELYAPQSEQVISERLHDIKNGEFRYLSIYEDGSLTSIQMEGLREPVSQHVVIKKTGKFDEEELRSLIEFFEISGFKEMNKNNEFPGSAASDMHYSVSARLGSSYQYVMASNYLSPDGGKTYPDMPYPLNEIYKRLKEIADNRTKEAAHES